MAANEMAMTSEVNITVSCFTFPHFYHYHNVASRTITLAFIFQSVTLDPLPTGCTLCGAPGNLHSKEYRSG
jgi:hypothetical protein